MARRRASNEELAGLVQGEQTDAVRRLEDRVAARVLGDLESRFAVLSQRSITAWVAAFGSVQAESGDTAALRRILSTIRGAVRRLLGPLGPRAQRELDQALTDAVLLGARQHAAFVEEATGRATRPVSGRPSRGLRRRAAAIGAAIADRRDRALAILRPSRARRWSDVQAGIGAAQSALPATRAHIATTVNEAVNEASLTAIDHQGAQKLWIAERDACVNCAAYSGMVVAADADFPAGLSWDPNQRGRGKALAAPPKHPHCRCRVTAWEEGWAPEGVPSFPDSLRREARRSIARGWSLPTESGAARIRAARELLRTGAGLPKSVEEFAALAVRAGRFTDRTVPTGP
ncbi:hypothetical protein SMD44_00928 [Streptomyces alboflavus]|uniref:Phage head morphogenesis domain-containing protein n=2 Tax=Streptomyces alboflavus TaxID=67267 RepID=A0A1Z1W549_9ACTN|nr:hypothetical protein SMD44_00928 [Streptomyces alboflavus]